jgi:hypothetical protein
MCTKQRPHRLAACFTLLAMVLALLAPGVSRALVFASGQAMPWGEICSASKTSRMAAGQQPAGSASEMLEACALCVPALDAPPLPVRLAPLALLPVTVGSAPRLFLPAPRALLERHTAQPRAPPASFFFASAA